MDRFREWMKMAPSGARRHFPAHVFYNNTESFVEADGFLRVWNSPRGSHGSGPFVHQHLGDDFADPKGDPIWDSDAFKVDSNRKVKQINVGFLSPHCSFRSNDPESLGCSEPRFTGRKLLEQVGRFFTMGSSAARRLDLPLASAAHGHRHAHFAGNRACCPEGNLWDSCTFSKMDLVEGNGLDKHIDAGNDPTRNRAPILVYSL